MNTMTIDGLRDLLSTGRFFSIEFIKRTTGELRVMNARTGVKKHLKGGELNYDPELHKLLPVYDVDKKGYRSIPLDAVQSITVDGTKYRLVYVEV